MVKLPKDKEEKLIRHMKVGENGYTVPWAMWVDKNRDCWLNEDYSISKEKGGTVELKIERLNEGYIAYINDIDYNWDTQEVPPYFASDETKFYGKIIGFTKKDLLENKLSEAIKKENYEEASDIKRKLKHPKT